MSKAANYLRFLLLPLAAGVAAALHSFCLCRCLCCRQLQPMQLFPEFCTQFAIFVASSNTNFYTSHAPSASMKLLSRARG